MNIFVPTVWFYQVTLEDEPKMVVIQYGRSLFSYLRRNGVIGDCELPAKWWRAN